VPTADEFDASAREFDQAALEVREAAQQTVREFGPSVMTGGSLTSSVERIVGEQAADAAASAVELTTLADECRRRAEVTRVAAAAAAVYAADLVRYEQALSEFEDGVGGSEPVAPVPPPDPPVWVEF